MPSLLRRLAFAVLVAAVVGVAWSGGRAPSPRPPANVLVIVVDSLRADAVDGTSAAGSDMPFIAALAARGIWYERAYAPAPWTLSSVASLFTSRYPSEHQVSWWNKRLAPNATTLAGVLRSHGYATGGLSAHASVAGEHGLEQGFDSLQTVGKPAILRAPDATEVNAAAVRWIDGRPRRQPFFLYLHYMDVHFPYRPHAGLTAPRSATLARTDWQLSGQASRGSAAKAEQRAELWRFTPEERKRLRQLYDGEARYLDQQLAELFAQLEKRGALDNTVVVVTADHGEEFGEHDVFGHATTLYDSALHVPLLVVWPGDRGGRRIVEPVAVAGLAPTLLGELGLDVPAAFHVPTFRMRSGSPTAFPHVFSELPDTSTLPLRLHSQAVTGETARLLVDPDGHESVFVDDPLERTPQNDSPQAAELRAALEATRRTLGTHEEGGNIALDAQTRERLRNLGYLTDE